LALWSEMATGVSVVVPALNEAESIGRVVQAMPWALIDECIVVDNGSSDDTGEVARAAGARVVTAPRGYGAACWAGSVAAMETSEVLVYADGDGADIVERMDILLQPIRLGEADFVIGSRLRGQREPGSMLASQVFAGKLIGVLVKLLYGFRYTDMCAFRAIRRESLMKLDMRERTFGWNLEMQIKAVQRGLRVVEVPVDYRCRLGGVSKVSGDFRASVKAAWRIFGVFWRVRRSGTQSTQN
jgi:glycosyltransferase involved in cell wall biosynthesis